jgi:hypothetical protein
MKTLERYAVLAALMQELSLHASWGGETHIQKAAYLAQELLGVPLGYGFRLYKHGPYSFDVRDELSAMRADEVIAIRPQSYPYGPKLVPTSLGEQLIDAHSSLVAGYRPALRFVAECFGSRGVAELERLSTAYLVTREGGHPDPGPRAQRLRKLKPHISMEAALAAVGEIDSLIGRARQLGYAQ